MARKVSRRSSLVARSIISTSGAGPLRVVYGSYSPVEAHIVKGMLEASGIACFLSNEFIAIVDNPVSTVTGGVKVQVRESDVAHAIELLQNR